MAALEPIPVEPKRPDPATIDWDRTVAEYDRDTDTFAFYFFGPRRPSVVFHTGAFADLLVDPRDEVIVGYQIEGFLSRAVYEQPWLLLYTELAGIPHEEAEEIRDRIVHGDRGRLAATFDTFVERAVARSA